MITDLRRGYADPSYAASLSEFGNPRHLPLSDGWILERPTPGGRYQDAMGCYPLFACTDWHLLASDLDKIEDLVSLAIVADPFGAYTPEELHACFPDVCKPFKEHFVVNLTSDPIKSVSSHHKRNAKKGLKNVSAEVSSSPGEYLEDWMRLYSVLIDRHKIQGIATFSVSAFQQQLQIPGIVAFRAVMNGETVGMVLWCVQENVAYYHLGAYDEVGYQNKASFALFWTAIEYFADKGIHWLNLGAGAGIKSDATDGLSRFKEGWSSGTKTAYFCGRIFDRDIYKSLSKDAAANMNGFFPSYRAISR